MADRTIVNRTNTGTTRLPSWVPQEPQFYAPLRTNIFNTYGKGLTTYSRASTATVFDHEGIMRDVLSGEARFQGARRVQNLYAYSQDISNSVWTAVSCTKQSNVTTAPDGTLTADRIQTNASTVFMEMFQNLDVVAGKTYAYSAYVKYHNWRYIQIFGNGLSFGVGYINIDLQTGTITTSSAGAGNFSGAITSVGNGWYRVSVTATCIATIATQHISLSPINTGTDPRVSAGVGDGTSGYYVWGMQYEDVTYQSVKTPGEYVSTNVMLAPFYHGACVDGVKYFDTKLDGTPIPETTIKGYYNEFSRTNIFLESKNINAASWTKSGTTTTANQSTGPDGLVSMAKVNASAFTGSQYVAQSITTTATNYSMSFYLKMGNHRYVQFRASNTISNGYVNFDLQTGTVGSSSLWTGYIENVRNGIYRCCIITETVLAATNVFLCAFANSLTDTRGVAFVGTGTEYFYASHAQLEVGGFASTYIDVPSTSAVTRDSDILRYSIDNVQSNQGSVSIQGWMPDSATVAISGNRRILLLAPINNNRIHILFRNTGDSNVQVFYGTGSGVTTAIITQSTIPNLDVNFGLTWSNGNYVNMYCNNQKVVSSSPAPNLVLTLIDVGGIASGAPTAFFGATKQLRIWKEIIPDTDMFKLTSTNV